MASPFRPSGVYVPLVTPFDDAGRVDLEALGSLADRVLDERRRGRGGAGDDRRADVAGRRRARGGRGCLRGGLRAPRRDADRRRGHQRHPHDDPAPRGAGRTSPARRASLAVVPYYVRPSETAIVRHFQAVAERSPVPLIVYNIPYRTGRGLGADALLELAATDNIAGLKQAVGRNRRRHAARARRGARDVRRARRRRRLSLSAHADGRHGHHLGLGEPADAPLRRDDRVRAARGRERGPAARRGAPAARGRRSSPSRARP